MARQLTGDVAFAGANHLGESVVWDDRSGELVWIDIHRGKLERWRADSGRTTVDLGERIGALGLRTAPGFVAAFATGFALLGADAETEQTREGLTADAACRGRTRRR